MKQLFLVLIIVSITGVACREDEKLSDYELITNYINNNNLVAEEHASGLFYNIEEPGNDQHPEAGDNVTIQFSGVYLDGGIFSQTAEGESINAELDNLIEGLKIGIPLLGIGGKGTFYLPGELAYGEFPPAGIPSNAIIIFDIDLIDINRNQVAFDHNVILDHLAENTIDAEEHSSGIFYIIDEPGNNEHPTINSSVTVRYRGYFLDGTTFDETMGNSTINFPLSDLIPGWQICIPLLGKGGSGTFFIPSGLAYGGSPPPGITANTVLAFDIELVDFSG